MHALVLWRPKTKTFLSQVRLECASPAQLQHLLSHVIACVIDMGPELGVANIPATATGVWGRLRDSVQASHRHPLQADDGGDALDCASNSCDMHGGAGSAHLLERALPIAGVLHVLANATCEIQTVLLSRGGCQLSQAC